MKKIILFALCWPIFSYPLFAQTDKIKTDSREIIIIKKGDKEKKLTIETKDGEVFINGKPHSEYKDGDVSVIRQKFKRDNNFLYAPGTGNFKLFDKDGEKKAFLGVTTEKVDDGVKIVTVSKGGPAEKAGLKEGDIITRAGNKNITTSEDLMDAVSANKPKDNVTVYYKREGRAGEVKATLGERTIARSFSFNNNNMHNQDFNFTMPKMPRMPHQPLTMAGFGRGRLGLAIEDTDNNSGAKITKVNDESPAAKAGLKENDIITEVNGNRVKDVNEVRKVLAEIKDKTSYNIKAKRNGSDMNFEIKIPKPVNKAIL